MHTPSPTELLAIWEEGSGRAPGYQALVLLNSAIPEKTWQELEMFSIGMRDASLLELRSLIFGQDMKGVVTCPNCSERLELNFTVDEIRTGPVRTEMAVNATEGTDSLSDKIPDLLYAEGTYQITYRLPTVREVAGISDMANPVVARSHLLLSCILSAKTDDRIIGPDEIPEEILTEICSLMGAADPGGNIRLEITCPSCTHLCEHLFDIVPYLWKEIDSWARKTMSEVHVLACRYGWSETEILAMSPWKRQRYIEMEGE
jgi:hypothetical protein